MPAKQIHADVEHNGYVDLKKNELRNPVAQSLAADPGTPVNGQFYYHSGNNKFRIRQGGAWQEIATLADVTAGGISVGLFDAKGDLLAGTGADAVSRLPVGTDNQILIADSTQATGLRWGAAPSGYTNEEAQDAVGSILTDSATIDFTYDDATPTITAIVIDASIANAKLANMAAATFKGRASGAGTGVPTDLTAAQAKTALAIVSTDISDFTTAARSSISVSDTAEIDLTYTAGAISGSLINASVSLARLATQASNTIVGNNTGGAASPTALTAAQVKTLLAIVPGDITGFDTQVRTSRLDQMAAPTAAVSLNSQKITGLADGTASTDAATFGQISALMSAQQWKDPVDAATTANIATLAGGAPNTLDGVTLAVGARVLVKNQTTPAQNGIYVVNTLGTGANGSWGRATDADTAAELTDATVLVQEGTDAKGDIYTFPAIATLGTTDATPVKTGEGNTVYAADGTTLTLTGSTFSISNGGVSSAQLNTAVAGAGLAGGGGTALSVNVGAGLEIDTDTVRISAAAAGNGLTGGAGSALAVGAGSGISVTADAVAVDGTVARKASGALTGGTNTEVLTHNFNTRDIAKVTLVQSSSPYQAIDDFYWEATSVNTVTVYAASGQNLPAGYRWVVIG
jgi:hypothetical protein